MQAEWPFGWSPRWYQQPAWDAFLAGIRSIILLHGRRCGKDETALRMISTEMLARPGNYWYIPPRQNQARKILWTALNEETGKQRLYEVFPTWMHAREPNNSEMMITIHSADGNVSTLQLLGSDNYKSLQGSSPVGLVWSEFGNSLPEARGFISPIVAKNKGIEIFASVSYGRNHYADLIDAKREDPDWHVSVVTSPEAGVITEAQIEDMIRQGMDRNLALMQFYCQLDVPVIGAVYGDELQAIVAEGRLTSVPYDPALAVYTSWDLGAARNGEPTTACWFYQIHGTQPHFIDYLEWTGKGAIDIIPDFVHYRASKKYAVAEDIFPHDLRSTTWGEATSREQICRNHGVTPTISSTRSISERGYVADGIEAARRWLRMAIFDKANTKRGFERLQGYRWEDQRTGVTRHDGCSHAADALRVGAMHRRRQATNLRCVDRWGGLRG